MLNLLVTVDFSVFQKYLYLCSFHDIKFSWLLPTLQDAAHNIFCYSHLDFLILKFLQAQFLDLFFIHLITWWPHPMTWFLNMVIYWLFPSFLFLISTLSWNFQDCITIYPLYLSSWLFNIYLELNQARIEILISPLPPSLSSISLIFVNGHSTYLAVQAKTLKSLWTHAINQKSFQL